MTEALLVALPLCALIVVLLGVFIYREHDHAVEKASLLDERVHLTEELIAALRATPPPLPTFLPPLKEEEDDLYDEPLNGSPDIDNMMMEN